VWEPLLLCDESHEIHAREQPHEAPVFEDRNATLNQPHYFDSNNINRLEGAIYLSRGHLWFDSNSQIGADSAFTTIVAHRLRLDSNSQLVLNADYGSSSVPSLAGSSGANVRLLE